jgi:hypothetical protein
MLGLVPSIHVLHTALAEDVDGRDEPDHDGEGREPAAYAASPLASSLTCFSNSAR